MRQLRNLGHSRADSRGRHADIGGNLSSIELTVWSWEGQGLMNWIAQPFGFIERFRLLDGIVGHGSKLCPPEEAIVFA